MRVGVSNKLMRRPGDTSFKTVQDIKDYYGSKEVSPIQRLDQLIEQAERLLATMRKENAQLRESIQTKEEIIALLGGRN